jgi:hypothetical protein
MQTADHDHCIVFFRFLVCWSLTIYTARTSLHFQTVGTSLHPSNHRGKSTYTLRILRRGRFVRSKFYQDLQCSTPSWCDDSAKGCLYLMLYWYYILDLICETQGDSRVPVYLQEHKYISHGEFTVATRHIWLKEGSGQGHSHVTHTSHAPLWRIFAQGLLNHFPLPTFVLTGA